jgi:hypothetical protein
MVEVIEIPFKEEYIPELSVLLGKEYLVFDDFFNYSLRLAINVSRF